MSLEKVLRRGVLFDIISPVVRREVLMPVSRSSGSKSVDNEMWNPSLHICLEQQGHPRRVRKLWVGPDDYPTSNRLCSTHVQKEKTQSVHVSPDM